MSNLSEKLKATHHTQAQREGSLITLFPAAVTITQVVAILPGFSNWSPPVDLTLLCCAFIPDSSDRDLKYKSDCHIV